MGTRFIALGAVVMAVAGCNALAGIEPGVLAQEDASADGTSDAPARPDGTAGEAGGTPDATTDGSGGQDAPTNDGSSPGEAGIDSGGTDGASGNDGGSAEGGCSGTTCNNGCLGDEHNCGSCGNDCTSLPHVNGSVTCNGGTCNVPTSSCTAGWTYCSGNGSGGCTTSLASTSNCGSCGNACMAADPDCAASGTTYTCVSGCSGGETLCSGSCVDSQTDPLGCGSSCTVCPTPGNGNAICTSGSCGITCDSGYNDCSGTCVANAPAACGPACTVCPTPGNGSATCPSGTCGISCNAGYNDCSGSCVADGPSSCGASCSVCPTPSNGSATCPSGTCGISCNAGYNDCSGTCVANSTSSCGPSCAACPAPPTNAAEACTAGTCGFTCNANYTACNGGCADYSTDAANCGSCGHSCGGGTCTSGACQPWVVTTAVTTPSSLASDGTNVVWGDDGTGEVEQVAAVGGGTPIVIGSGYGKTLTGLSMESGKIAYTTGTHIYVGTEGTANSGTLLATATYPISGSVLNPSATTAYVAEAATATSGYDGAILQCALSGSSCSSLITLSNAFVYGLLVDANYLFWADNNNQLIGRYVFSSGTQANVVTSLDVNIITMNGTTLYWALNAFSGTIYSTPESTPGAQSTVCTVPVPTSDGLIYSLAADASYVYAGTDGSSTQPASLVACPAGGGSPTTLYSTAANAGSVTAVVAAGGYVFWIDDQASYTIKAIRAP